MSFQAYLDNVESKTGKSADQLKAIAIDKGLADDGGLAPGVKATAIVDWLKNLRAADPGLSTVVDAYSVHPYPYPRTQGPDVDHSDPRWDYQRVQLTRQIDPSLPIWITEVGWSTASTEALATTTSNDKRSMPTIDTASAQRPGTRRAAIEPCADAGCSSASRRAGRGSVSVCMPPG